MPDWDLDLVGRRRAGLSDSVALPSLRSAAAALDGSGLVLRATSESTFCVGHRCSNAATDSGRAATLLFEFHADAPFRCSVVDDAPKCDLFFDADEADVVAAIMRVPQNFDFLDRFKVDDRGAGGRWHGPLPPLDLRQAVPLNSLPIIDGASALVQLVLTDSPFGIIAFVMSVTDGKIDRIELGGDADAEVFIQLRYADYLRVRAEKMLIADALRHGDIDGHFGKLQMFSGLIQSPPFRALYDDAFSSNVRLAEYADLVANEGFRETVEAARAKLGLAYTDSNT